MPYPDENDEQDPEATTRVDRRRREVHPNPKRREEDMLPVINLNETVRAVGTFVGKFGLATAIAVFLIYQMTAVQSGQIKESIDQLKDLNGQLMHASQAIRTHSDDSVRQWSILTSIMRQTCVNTATTNEERRACVQ